MCVYDNESKRYPDLNPTAPQEPQTNWLNKLSEIELFFLMKLKNINRRQKKIKRSITIFSMADTSLITSAVLTGGISIAALASGAGLPVRIVLGEASLLFSFVTPSTQKYLKSHSDPRKTRLH